MKKRTLKDAVAEERAKKPAVDEWKELCDRAVGHPEAPVTPPAAPKPEPDPKAAKPEKKPQPAPGTGKRSKTRRNCCATKRGKDVTHLPECPTLKPAAKLPDLSSDHGHGDDV